MLRHDGGGGGRSSDREGEGKRKEEMGFRVLVYMAARRWIGLVECAVAGRAGLSASARTVFLFLTQTDKKLRRNSQMEVAK